MRSWYTGRDLLGLPNEMVIGVEPDAGTVVHRILDSIDVPAPPVRDRTAEHDHVT
jgi:hypothetical protein